MLGKGQKSMPYRPTLLNFLIYGAEGWPAYPTRVWLCTLQHEKRFHRHRARL